MTSLEELVKALSGGVAIETQKDNSNKEENSTTEIPETQGIPVDSDMESNRNSTRGPNRDSMQISGVL